MSKQDYERINKSYTAVIQELDPVVIAANVLSLIRIIEREELFVKGADETHKRLVELNRNLHSAKYLDGLAFYAMAKYRGAIA